MNKSNFIISILALNSFFIHAEITSGDLRAVVRQNDQKLLCAGTFIQNKQNVIGCARYLPSGILDADFGDRGLALIGQGEQAEANAVNLQSTGKIILAGFYSNSTASYCLCLRLLANGALDTSFAQNGYLIETDLENAQIVDIAIQSDDKILVCGTYAQEGQLHIFLIRYTADGIRDVNFGQAGIATYRLGYHSGACGLALQTDNKIIISGFNVSDVREILLVRFNADGTLDAGYGDQGVVITANGASSQPEAIVIDQSNNAFIAGTSDNQFLVAKYTPTGILDANFGSNGLVIVPVGIWASAFALDLQVDGKIVAAGYADQSFAAIRLLSTGALDTSFNQTGIITKLIANNGNCARGIELDDSQKIYIVGSASNSSFVARFSSSGLFDTTWGGNGIVTYPTFSLGNPLTIIADFKTSGTNGGTFVSGEWITRDLNQIITASSNIALRQNYFSLQPGTYDIAVFAPAFMCGNHKIRLQNITDDITESYGVAAYSSPSSATSVSNSFLEMTLVVNEPKDYAVQHRCSVTRLDDGLGLATGFEEVEVYTSVKIIEK